MKIMTAKYAGECAITRCKIRKGDIIAWSPGYTAHAGSHLYRHPNHVPLAAARASVGISRAHMAAYLRGVFCVLGKAGWTIHEADKSWKHGWEISRDGVCLDLRWSGEIVDNYYGDVVIKDAFDLLDPSKEGALNHLCQYRTPRRP